MILLIIVSLLNFLFFYLACLYFTKSKKRLFILCFVFCSLLLRGILNPVLNNDFYLYYNFNIFQKPTSFLSFFINEPYLYSIYLFFSIFSDDKLIIFSCIYWFNHIITTVFFVWLLNVKDVQGWKKMVLFSIFYFFISFVLLRNGPVYLLFALYFYYNFRNTKFNYVLVTPFMHISAIVMLIVYFHKWKNYYIYFFIICILLPIFFLISKPLLQEVDVFHRVIFKINQYLILYNVPGILDWLFFAFVSTLLIGGILLYRMQIRHPFLITTAAFYYIAYIINPIVAFRFSPYFLFAILLMNFDDSKNKKVFRILNLLSIFIFPVYLFVLYHTHHI